MLRATGRSVEVQNYIDNTGVQVADVVVGFQHLEKKSPAEVRDADRDHAVRLPVLGSLRAHVRVLRGASRKRWQWRARDAARDRGRARATRRKSAHLVADAIVERASARPCGG